jgi:hypothetical protein
MERISSYDETPEDMADCNEVFFKNGWLHMVGGCRGSTPAHIKPRMLPDVGRSRMWLSGPDDLLSKMQYYRFYQIQEAHDGRRLLSSYGHCQEATRGWSAYH